MSGTSQEKKRKVAYTMFEKWRRDFDREFETISWLECESAFHESIMQLIHMHQLWK